MADEMNKVGVIAFVPDNTDGNTLNSIIQGLHFDDYPNVKKVFVYFIEQDGDFQSDRKKYGVDKLPTVMVGMVTGHKEKERWIFDRFYPVERMEFFATRSEITEAVDRVAQEEIDTGGNEGDAIDLGQEKEGNGIFPGLGLFSFNIPWWVYLVSGFIIYDYFKD